MVVKYMHHGDDLVEHRTREACFGAQCTNHSANSMCSFKKFTMLEPLEFAAALLHGGNNSQLLSDSYRSPEPFSSKIPQNLHRF